MREARGRRFVVFSVEEQSFIAHNPQQEETCTQATEMFWRLLIFLAIALVLRLAVFHFLPSIYYADEIYQVQEPAHRLAFGNGVTTWEYRVGARSWVLPAIIAGVMKCSSWLAAGSAGYVFGVGLFASLISLAVVWFAFAWCRRYFGMEYALLGGFAAAVWFELIYFAPRPFNEFIAGNLLLPAIYWGSLVSGGKREPPWRLILVGVLLGLTVSLRMQLGPAVLVAGVWTIGQDRKQRLVPIACAMVVVVAAFGMVDAFTWSYPFQSYYVNLSENVFKHKAAQFGITPWYSYLYTLLRHTGPLPILAVIGVRRSPILGWLCLAILVPHLLIGHKEYRFIYPLLPFLITLSAIGLMDLQHFVERRRQLRFSGRTRLLLAASFLLIFSLALGLRAPYWTSSRGYLLAFSSISRDRGVCGVAIAHDDWYLTGGYTYLGRSIPIFLFPRFDDTGSNRNAFNAIVASDSSTPPLQGYGKKNCWDGICLYEREGVCQAGALQYEFSAVLKRNSRWQEQAPSARPSQP